MKEARKQQWRIDAATEDVINAWRTFRADKSRENNIALMFYLAKLDETYEKHKGESK